MRKIGRFVSSKYRIVRCKRCNKEITRLDYVNERIKINRNKIYQNIMLYPETRKYPFIFCSEKCKILWMNNVKM